MAQGETRQAAGRESRLPRNGGGGKGEAATPGGRAERSRGKGEGGKRNGSRRLESRQRSGKKIGDQKRFFLFHNKPISFKGQVNFQLVSGFNTMQERGALWPLLQFNPFIPREKKNLGF